MFGEHILSWTIKRVKAEGLKRASARKLGRTWAWSEDKVGKASIWSSNLLEGSRVWAGNKLEGAGAPFKKAASEVAWRSCKAVGGIDEIKELETWKHQRYIRRMIDGRWHGQACSLFIA